MKKIVFTFLLLSLAFGQCSAQVFKVNFADSISNRTFTGRVLLYLSKNNINPKNALPGADIFSCFSIEVAGIKPMGSVIIDDQAHFFPVKLSEIERGTYNVQVVWDRNQGGRLIAETPGNIYSKTQKITIGLDSKQVYTITAKDTIKEKLFNEETYTKEIRVNSTLLSAFYHRATTINAAVLLPQDYFSTPNKKFPVLFYMLDFGGDYHSFSGRKDPGKPIDSSSCITVILDGNCPQGNSEYANSENNGPWGDALTKEFIPSLEHQFHSNGARLITGSGSGGWSALWLQINYPTIFCGCWASSPDAVDFRSFRKLNIYANDNLYYGKDGLPNPAAVVGGKYSWYSMKSVIQMEKVIYRGQQMHSYNAVFSKRGTDGEPEPVCNYATGETVPSVVSHWKNYDISFILQNQWAQLKSNLDGKIRITAARQDNFMVNFPVTLLDSAMKKINAGIEISYYPGDHFTVATPEFTKDGFSFLERKYQEWKSIHAIK